MDIVNLANLPEKKFAKIEKDLTKHKTLGQVLDWASTKPIGDFIRQIVREVVSQDEYTNDVIIPFRDLYLVFDTT